jgi:FlaA1/EpsC-like NDP-sugar epimerase
MRRYFDDPRLGFVIGDVRDREKLSRTVKAVDAVFHLAALKHVPVCEEDPWEAVQTNIHGTRNLISAAQENGVERVIYVSTDKACDPLNVYGITKAFSEKLIVSANRNTPGTIFTSFRAGNVVGSSGSVIPLFRQQIKTHNTITITDERMTRFFMTRSRVIELLLEAAAAAVGGEIFVTRMDTIRITDLAEVMIAELGDGQTEVRRIGVRPGEKIREVLVSRNESARARAFGDCWVVMPLVELPATTAAYGGLASMGREEYDSESEAPLSKPAIRELLLREGWFETEETALMDFLKGLSREEVERIIKVGGWL